MFNDAFIFRQASKCLQVTPNFQDNKMHFRCMHISKNLHDNCNYHPVLSSVFYYTLLIRVSNEKNEILRIYFFDFWFRCQAFQEATALISHSFVAPVWRKTNFCFLHTNGRHDNAPPTNVTINFNHY